MTRDLRPLAALALIAVVGAGCANGAAADSGTTDTTHREQAMTFSACMRQNGVTDFPDPDASGELTIDQIANGTSLDTASAAFQRALTACKDLEPSGFTGSRRSPEQQQAALKFAQCMRDHGVPDFPDPAVGDPLVDTNRIPSSAGGKGMAALNAAMGTCGALYSGELGLTGR